MTLSRVGRPRSRSCPSSLVKYSMLSVVLSWLSWVFYLVAGCQAAYRDVLDLQWYTGELPMKFEECPTAATGCYVPNWYNGQFRDVNYNNFIFGVGLGVAGPLK